MRHIPIFNQKTNDRFFHTDSNGRKFFYHISDDGIESRQHDGIGNTIDFREMNIPDDVILSANDILTSFQSYYNDMKDITEGFEPVSLSLSDVDVDTEINRGFSHLQNEVVDKMREIYSSPQKYNTDIVITRDGTVRTHDYFGSIAYRDKDIVYTKTVTPYDIDSYLSHLKEGLSESQEDYCIKNNYITIWATKSEDKSDWQEFTTNDDDGFIDDFNKMVEAYNESCF